MALLWYLDPNQAAPSTITKPSGLQGGWHGSASNTYYGPNACKMSITAPAGPQVAGSYINSSGAGTYGVFQFCSDPIAAGTYGFSATWAAGLACAIGGANACAGEIFVGIMSNDGTTLRGGISGGTANVGAASTSASELTRRSTYGATVWNNVTAQNNDYLLVEIGVQDNSSSGGQTRTVYAGGTTAITTDGVATSDAQAFLSTNTDIPLFVDSFPVAYPVLITRRNPVYRM